MIYRPTNGTVIEGEDGDQAPVPVGLMSLVFSISGPLFFCFTSLAELRIKNGDDVVQQMGHYGSKPLNTYVVGCVVALHEGFYARHTR